MVFSSTIFLFMFLPVTLAIYYNPFIRTRQFRNIFLLVASLLFYAWGEPVNVFLMMLSIVIGWAIGSIIQREQNHRARKRWLIAGITIYILIFFVFKYLTFIVDQVCLLLGVQQGVINIALPIGISFYLFQLMSYLFDIYYSRAIAQTSILNVGLYISLFPQLIAGPIVRYTDIENQIQNRKENIRDFSQGLMRFSFGLGKKVLLANYFGIVADNIFPNVSYLSVLSAWIGACAYSLQIYFDFSGYSDMAIGLGKMFGFRFMENFNYPYISKSVTEFWRRWHISLSTWFRDYVYIPMGGNRVNRSRWILNLLTVWLLTGIWHGANWTFLLWGLLYFAILLVERLVSGKISVPIFIGHIYTLFTVIIAWVVFRSQGIKEAFVYMGRMFPGEGKSLIDEAALYYLNNSKWLFLMGIILSTPIGSNVLEYLKSHNKYWIVAAWNVAIFIVSIIFCISSTYNPFIYFNF